MFERQEASVPELPEVETICRGIAPVLEDQQISWVVVRRTDLRVPIPEDFVQATVGATVLKVARRAKYILIHLDRPQVILMHMGMSGRLTIGRTDQEKAKVGHFYADKNERSSTSKHDHVIIYSGKDDTLTFTDPRRFGLITLAPAENLGQHKLLSNLGVEPLSEDLTYDFFANALKGRKSPIKAALLDQRIVAGIGNIYACEALFRARISPKRSSSTIGRERSRRLREAVRDVLNEAIEAGGSTLRDFAQADGDLGYFQHRFQVYDRENQPCITPGCDSLIKRLVQSNRSTFYCSACQR